MVVETDEGIRSLLSTILRLSNYQVLSFTDGDEALDDLRQNPCRVNLLITDIFLGPSLDGLELAEDMRLLYPNLKTLFLSGRNDRIELKEEIESGRAWFLGKPFKPSQLTQKIETILSEALTPI